MTKKISQFLKQDILTRDLKSFRDLIFLKSIFPNIIIIIVIHRVVLRGSPLAAQTESNVLIFQYKYELNFSQNYFQLIYYLSNVDI